MTYKPATTQEDLDRIGDTLIRAGELLKERGVRAVTRAGQLASGAMRAANLDGGGGGTGGGYGDPTGNLGAGQGDAPAPKRGRTTDELLAFQLQSAIGLGEQASVIIRDHVLRLVPASVPKDNTCPAGWCRSCYRDNHHHEPERTKPDGTPNNVGLCWWCAGFQTDYGQLPVVPLLQIRHTGRRVSETDVARHMPHLKGRKKKVASR